MTYFGKIAHSHARIASPTYVASPNFGSEACYRVMCGAVAARVSPRRLRRGSGSDEPCRRWRAAIMAALRGHFGRRRPGRRPAALQNRRRRGLRWNCTKIICDLDTSTEATTQELHPATAAGAPPWPRPGPAAPCTQACKDQLHSMADFVQGSLMLRYNQRMVG